MPSFILGQASFGLVTPSRRGSDPYGPELLTNGDFSDGSTGWTAHSGTPVFENDALTFDAGNSRVDQSIPALAGRTYRVEMVVSSYTSGAFFLQFTGATPTIGTVFNAAGTHVEELTLSVNGNASIRTQGGSTDFVLDSISIKEVL